MIAIAIIFCFMLLLSPDKADRNGDTSVYTLIDENGTVKLYSEKEIISVYEEIVTSNLPTNDRIALRNGIEFDSLEKAQKAVEDYDG